MARVISSGASVVLGSEINICGPSCFPHLPLMYNIDMSSNQQPESEPAPLEDVPTTVYDDIRVALERIDRETAEDTEDVDPDVKLENDHFKAGIRDAFIKTGPKLFDDHFNEQLGDISRETLELVFESEIDFADDEYNRSLVDHYSLVHLILRAMVVCNIDDDTKLVEAIVEARYIRNLLK